MPSGKRKPTYVDNIYNQLIKQGLAPKYQHPGIYSISIDG